ncbi:ferritin-like domain-containing protein (plasmid) [Rhizobium rosettiformans]|uniref:Ferritin-like domain-containing protein n=1 Tax=Rhizobium rosettiformans TaxID=1368430 RepID=A0ABX7F1R3_9HYPH|nr:ferritin-like domain-containing protein [Rhizobium rosettiformans]QRF54479.1 ferritin-like domain-containing protein [Rhizobium rosettiformans]
MTENPTRKIFITGLKNAHAMENQALSIMKPQVKRIENYPEIAAKLDQHIRETERQIARLEELLTSLGQDHSSLKDMALSAVGSMAALSHTVAGDEILKNSFANFAFENFEIAAYKSLIALAELAGYQGLVSSLQANLDEEIRMAEWLESNLHETTMRFAALSKAGQTAKV